MLEKSRPPGMRKWQIIVDPQMLFHPPVKLQKIPTPVLPSRASDQAAGIQFTLQTLPLVDVLERRRRCNLAVEMLMGSFFQSPWGSLVLTQTRFSRKMGSLRGEESIPEDGMWWGGVKDDFSRVSSWVSRSCWPTCFLQCWMNLGTDRERNLIQVLANWIKPSALSPTPLGLWGRRDTSMFGCSWVVPITSYLRDLYKPYSLSLPRVFFIQTWE